ncbi:hypothetical protein AN639_05115 [Candidatus Epulonipiscium fishelsonii]|uniref:Uncharacterized protein n=1 Tax=Candidatus Epulonipiscium fishelsonii TaxID=77094 RepID=A0ACC8XC30_9FIRM|nr:hypothetical protein AN396_06840 [Epulopiscium sp. SCG-B11WGA-EpuloA1]ONI40266.1 hypothetical protein AN639_05115 [Epulopiscium sp. SCG-B05WGA-EpuloA1]
MCTERRDKMNKLTTTKLLLWLYIIVVIELILFKGIIPFTETYISRSINVIPFHETLKINGKIRLSDFIDNILIFIPFGMSLSVLKIKDTIPKLKIVVLTFAFSLILELGQYIFGLGVTDVTDLITNTLGGFIGVLIIIVAKPLINTDLIIKCFNIFYIFVNILGISLIALIMS